MRTENAYAPGGAVAGEGREGSADLLEGEPNLLGGADAHPSVPQRRRTRQLRAALGVLIATRRAAPRRNQVLLMLTERIGFVTSPVVARDRQRLLRLADLEREGYGRVAVMRRVARGELVQVGRGIYADADFEPTEHHDLALVAARAPKAVVCLLSAAAFHRLGTQVPHEVWIALAPRVWAPRMSAPPLRVVRFSGARFEEGIGEHEIEGIPVRVYSVAKTVVDLFRYRNKIGLDVALEALREARRDRRCSLAQLAAYARAGGVLAPMRPYLEAT